MNTDAGSNNIKADINQSCHIYLFVTENRCAPLDIPQGVLFQTIRADKGHFNVLRCPEGHVFQNGRHAISVKCDFRLTWNNTVGACNCK